jgi:glycosyltransferase involved in cell wall biosynthesis
MKTLICSNINGCKEMVKGGFNGFLAAPKSVKSLSNALVKFTNLSFKDKVKFGSNSRLLLKKNGFDENKVIAKYLKVIK